DNRCRCWPKLHRAQHAAANTQIGAGAITPGRLDCESWSRQLHVFDTAIFQLYIAGVDVVCRALHSAVANREAYAGDVDTSGLRAERISFADLHFLNRDIGGVAVALDVDRFRVDAVNRRVARMNLSGFGCRD